LLGNRWLPQTTGVAQAIFFRRRHQPRRPPPANIRPFPWRPEDDWGPITAAVVLILILSVLIYSGLTA
jgi:hypothetical protein